MPCDKKMATVHAKPPKRSGHHIPTHERATPHPTTSVAHKRKMAAKKRR